MPTTVKSPKPMRDRSGQFTSRRPLRLPATPLLEFASGQIGTNRLVDIAGFVDRPLSSVRRWRNEGIPWDSADRVACDLGQHVAIIWESGQLTSRNRDRIASPFVFDHEDGEQ